MTYFQRGWDDYQHKLRNPPREKKSYREYNQGWEAAKRKSLRFILLTRSP